VTVEDDGKGTRPVSEAGHGLSLVAAFAEQLQGRIEREQVERGTRTTVCFPLAV
jgi:two-component sensor histidine kinase